MNKLNELLNELNAIIKQSKNLNEPDTRQYILALIEQIYNETLED